MVTIIPIVIGAFGTVTKRLLKGLEDLEVGVRVETIQLQHYWERPEYWEESWRLEETYTPTNSSERPSAKSDVKNSQWVNNNKYLDLIRELKKLWNINVTSIPFVIGAFGTITKWSLKSLEDLGVGQRVETIQMTTLQRTARILRRVLETWVDLLSLKLHWLTIS